MRPTTPENPPRAEASRGILPDLLAEVSGGGFAGSPDVPASRLCAGFGYSLHAGHRAECETSGLGGRTMVAMPRIIKHAGRSRPAGTKMLVPALAEKISLPILG